MKKQKMNWWKVLLATGAIAVSAVGFECEVQAAQSGTFPGEGAVTWELDDAGKLTFSGNGSIGIYGGAGGWSKYWQDQSVSRQSVTSVEVDDGSNIILKYCGSMFSGFSNCTSIDTTGFDTSEVTNMSYMFEGCKKITKLDLSGFNTDKVNNMSDMFSYCSELVDLDVSKFDTSEVRDMSGMFEYCYELTNLDVSGFNTSKVTDMESMFRECTKLTKLDVSGFDTSNVTNMRSMFMQCYEVENLDVSNFNTSKVIDMSHMFDRCCSVKKLDVSGFDTRNVVSNSAEFIFGMSAMFQTCSSLTKLDISNFDTTNVEKVSVYGCESLQTLITPKTQTTIEMTRTSEKVWVDKEKNFYTDNHCTFPKSTTLTHIDTKYDINYVYEGELVNCPDTYEVETGLAELGSVENENKSFFGWYLDSEYKTAVTSIEKGMYGDVTLYARQGNKYAITYKNVNDATFEGTVLSEYISGGEYKLPIPSRKTFIFKGWYTDEACTKLIKNITKTTTGDLILYAKWEEAQKEQPKADKDEEEILKNESEDDIKGSSFGKLRARIIKTKKNSIKIKWNKVKGADGYLIYGTKCGKTNQYKLIKTIKNGKTTTFTQKKLKKGTYYRYVVRAYKIVNGKKITVSVSKTVHGTTTGGKYGNAKVVKVNKSKITLKKNKKFKLKAKDINKSKKIRRHRKVTFESSNRKIATVTKKGVIKAKKKGTCYIYAYSQNGVYKKIKVKVY